MHQVLKNLIFSWGRNRATLLISMRGIRLPGTPRMHLAGEAAFFESPGYDNGRRGDDL